MSDCSISSRILVLALKSIKSKSVVYERDFTHLLGKVAIATINAWQPTWEANKLFAEERSMLLKLFLMQIPSHPYDGRKTKGVCLFEKFPLLSHERIVYRLG